MSEAELLRLERKLDEEVRGSLFQNQREFYLQEQLKAIHRELGEEDSDDASDLERQIEARKLPEAVKTRAMREMRKLRRMSPLSPESTVARNFIDWIVALPWTERTDDVLDVAHARRDSRRGSLRARGSEGSHPRLHRRAVARRTHGRPHSLSRRAARRRQDVARPVHRPGAGTQVRAHVARRRARRSRDPRAPAHVHRVDARARRSRRCGAPRW